jgi:hypothetical protein
VSNCGKQQTVKEGVCFLAKKEAFETMPRLSDADLNRRPVPIVKTTA